MKEIVLKVYDFHELDEDVRNVIARDIVKQIMSTKWWQTDYDAAKAVGVELEGFNSAADFSLNIKCVDKLINIAEAITKDFAVGSHAYKVASRFIEDHAEFIERGASDIIVDYIEEGFIDKLKQVFIDNLRNTYKYYHSFLAVEQHIKANNLTFYANGKVYTNPEEF